jgi:hypothetical protein
MGYSGAEGGLALSRRHRELEGPDSVLLEARDSGDSEEYIHEGLDGKG